MRIVLAALLSLTSSITMAADAWPPATEYTYEGACENTKDEAQCNSNAQSFTGYYNRAIQGDLVGQRMVAMALADDMVGIKKRPSLACAWSDVLIRSGDLRATPDDSRNHRYFCDSLPPDERVLAKSQADQILKLIAP